MEHRKRIFFGLREKVILTVIGISMLMIAFLSFLFYNRAVDTIRNNYEEAIASSLSVSADTFDSVMKDGYFACIYAAYSEEMKALMHRDTTYEKLTDLLERIQGSSSSIYSVYCYITEEDIIVKVSADGIEIAENSPETEAWISSIADEKSENQFSPTYNTDSSSAIQRTFFTYEKQIKNGDEILGILFVNIDERDIYFKCLQSEETKNTSCYITEGNKVVSATDTGILNTTLVEQSNTISVSKKMSMTDYSMVSVSDFTAITAELRKTRNWILLVAVLLNFVFCIPVFFIVRRMMYPMKELEKTMNQVKEGDLTIRADIYRHDEIGNLSENFNEMIEQVERLIDELVKEKMLKKEAEIEALQYQITPHFMYNTLSSIRYAALMQNSNEIAALLQAFIELLRLSASDRGAFITIQQEIRMVHNYVTLQQFRYQGSFDVVFDVEQKTELFYVPRLIIQPLVENAILHGLNHCEGKNRIEVRVIQDGRFLAIQVKDNGVGMTREEQYNLTHDVRKSKFSGIGISNIRERLQLYYGDQGSLTFYSSSQHGTTAMITLPIADHPDIYTI